MKKNLQSDFNTRQYMLSHDFDAGHFYTENPVSAYLAERLRAAFPEITVKISETHGDCMKFY